MTNGRTRRAIAVAPLLCLLPVLASAQSSSSPIYTMKADGWWRTEVTGTFRVDPEVISARFVSGVADLDALRALVGELGGPAGELLGDLQTVRSNRLGIHDLRVPEGADVLEAVSLLHATGLCEFVEENTIGVYGGASNDPALSNQWHFVNTGQSGGTPDADVDADIAWAITTGDPNIVVGVLDSGTAITHPDLQFGTWHNAGEIPNNGQDDDNNGFIDDVDGWDFHNNNNDVPGTYFHGTAVTGLISAHTNNGTGIAGLAGGFGAIDGCKTMACGVGDTAPNASILDDAILYATDNGAAVITMSLSIGNSTAVRNAMDEATNNQNRIVDCAAGNTNGGPVSFPASDVNCLAIPATDNDDDRAGFSAIGPENWLAAPGESVYTTDTGNGYTFTSGTSFSAPHIAAGAALVFSVLPNTSNESVKEILRVTADDVGSPGYDNQTGWGRLNAGSAVTLASNEDCNTNGIWDTEDITGGGSNDGNGNGIPDECECPSAFNFCQTAPNSNGAGCTIFFTGSQNISMNNVVLHATGASTSQPGIFYYGTMQQNLAFGNGFRCAGGSTFRLPATTTDGFGDASGSLDLDDLPSGGDINPGDERYFQFWFRDPVGGGAAFNLSDGLAIPFCP